MTVKTPFPYPGGKSVYAHRIIDQFPRHNCYAEVFGGAGSVLLQKEPSMSEVYNDINDDVTNFFRVLRDRHDALVRYLRHTPYSYSLHQDILDRWYGEGVRPDDDVQRAAEFFFLRFANYGAVFKRSGFSASNVRSEAGKFQRRVDALDDIRDRYVDVVIENRDWQHVMAKYDGPDTLFYCDPPYLHIDDDGMYGSDDPTQFDHQRFCEYLHDVIGDWVVSYSEVPPELEDYHVIQWDQNWKMTRGKADGDTDGTESLILSFDPATVSPYDSVDSTGW